MKTEMTLSAAVLTFVVCANVFAGLGLAVGDVIGDLIGGPEPANSNLQTNSGSSNCNGQSSTGYSPSDTTLPPAASWHFQAPISYIDCWNDSDSITVYFDSYSYTPGMTCLTPSQTTSITDTPFVTDSISWTADIGGCYRNCTQDGWATTLLQVTEQGEFPAQSNGYPYMYKGC